MEHYREGETTGSSFFGTFPFDGTLRRRRILVYLSLFSVAIPVNYNSEFLLIVRVNSGNVLKLQRIFIIHFY